LLRQTREHPHPYLTPELRARILVERDAIDIGDGEARAIQAISKSGARERFVVFEPGKPLFLSGRKNSPVLHQAASGIMVAGGYADDVHGLGALLRRISLRSANDT